VAAQGNADDLRPAQPDYFHTSVDRELFSLRPQLQCGAVCRRTEDIATNKNLSPSGGQLPTSRQVATIFVPEPNDTSSQTTTFWLTQPGAIVTLRLYCFYPGRNSENERAKKNVWTN